MVALLLGFAQIAATADLDGLYRAGRFEEVAARAEAALRETPGRADLLTRLGAASFRLRRWDAAESAFRSALKASARDPQAQLGLANTLLARGKAAESIPVFERLVSQNGSHAGLRRSLAQAYGEANRYSDADALLRALIQADAKDLQSWLLLGTLAYRQGYYAAALGALDTSLALDPRSIDARIRRAGALDALGKVEQAEAAFRELAAMPELEAHPGLLLGYGQFLLQSGQAADALARLDRAVKLEPDLAVAHLWRARALLRLGKTAEAAEAAERAEALDPRSGPPKALLVRLYRLLGKEDSAAKRAEWLRQAAGMAN